MLIKIVRQAWTEFLKLSNRGQAILQALKKFDYGHGAWPSVRTLSNLTGYCVRSVQYAIQELKSKGYISVLIRMRWNRSQTSNLYVIHKKGKNAPLDRSFVNNNNEQKNLLKWQEIQKLIKDRAKFTILDYFAQEIEKNYTLSQLVKALAEYHRQVKKGITIRNPGGWLRYALRDGYQIIDRTSISPLTGKLF